MSSWNKDFGESRKSFISAKLFDGDGTTLRYRSYKKIEPDDLEYIIGGTQNVKIKDSKGNLVLDKNGKEIKNTYHDEKFPNGYQIQFEFDEGTLSCTSFPMLKEMHRISPEDGDLLNIKRDASVVTQTKYYITKSESLAA